MSEPTNIQKLKQSWSQLNDKNSWLFTHMADTLLNRPVGMKGRKGDTSLAVELAWLPENFASVRNVIAENTAVQKNLVAAIAALAKGEKFDEAKLLAGVQAAAQAGVKAAIDSIETTTTVNMKEK